MILGGIPLFVMSGVWEFHQWEYLDWNGWMALAYATIFGSAIAYGLFFYIASQSNLTSFTSLTFLTPVFALLFGNLLLSETLTLIQWGGVSLTLIGVYLINQREKLSQGLRSVQLTPDQFASCEEVGSKSPEGDRLEPSQLSGPNPEAQSSST